MIEIGGKIKTYSEVPTSKPGTIARHITLVNDALFRTYTTFNELPDNANVGDNIYFSYEEVQKGDKTYYNIKEVRAVEKIGETPTDNETQQVINERKDKPEEVSKIDPNKAIVMECAVKLCLARNDFSDESIKASYERLLKIMEN